jgi:ABC-type multidrug transport system fused ATPase/permease subunit
LSVVNFTFKRELFLGAKTEGMNPVSPGIDEKGDRSIHGTICDSMKLIWKSIPGVVIARSTVAAMFAATPLLWSYGSGRIVGEVTALGTTSTTIIGGLLVIGGLSIMNDLIGRFGGIVSAWQWRRRDRMINRLASTTAGSWSFEELEDSKKQLLQTRFKQHGSRLLDLMDSIFDASAATLAAGGAALLTLSLDWRLSAVACGFVIVRMCRDLREAETSHRISKFNATERRRLSVVGDLAAEPQQLRDMRQLGKHHELAIERDKGMAAVDRRELANEARVQTIKLTMDVIPALLAVTGVAVIAQHFTAGMLNPNLPQMTPEKMVAVIGYIWTLLQQCRAFGFQIGKVVEHQTFASEALEYVSSHRTPPETQIQLPRRPQAPVITLSGVKVMRDERCILNVPKLTILPGEIIGIIGPEGAGKSTLMKVILGMREPTVGSVTLRWGESEYDLKDVAVSSWHEMIGNYSQDFEPPNGLSVKRMLNLGSSNNPVNRDMSIEEVLELCEAAEFVKKNPKGVDTVVGAGWDDGVAYSGGQKKLLGLTQALRRRPPIVILDEPSANISKGTAKKVLEAICEKARQEHRTVMIVTHNIENLSFVDRIIGLRDAEIKQDGTPQELFKEPGEYRNGLIAHSEQALQLIGYRLEADPNAPERFQIVPATEKSE